MKITLLGTGTSQGVPVVGCHCATCQSQDPRDKRLRTAAFVEAGDVRLLLDAGPDLRQQLLRQEITRVDAVLVTHEHKDHIGGLDDLRPIYFRQEAPIPVYGLQRVLKVVRKDYDYAFKANPYPGAPGFQLIAVRDEPFSIKGVEILPIHVRHLTLPILGYRIGKLAYITDASFIAESELRKLEGLDLLVINALRIKEHYSHFNLEQALTVIQRLQPRRAVLTHISDKMGPYVEVAPLLPDNVKLGEDGMELRVES